MLESPSLASTWIFESLIISLFLLHVKETGLTPLIAVQLIVKSVPIFVFGINKGATSGLSDYEHNYC